MTRPEDSETPETPEAHDSLELRDLIDASFGAGPTPPSPTARLRLARRALRRRRALSGVAAAGATAATVAVVLALTPGSGTGSSTVAPAGSGPNSPTATATRTPATGQSGESHPDPVADCVAAINGLVDLDPAQLNKLHLTYDAATGRLRLPEEAVTASIDPDGDLRSLECTVRGRRVTLETLATLRSLAPSLDQKGGQGNR